MKYHLSKGVWKRCRAVVQPGYGVSNCQLNNDHAVGRAGVAAAGGGYIERMEDGEVVRTYISEKDRDGMFYAKSPKGFERHYFEDGTVYSLRDRARNGEVYERDDVRKAPVEQLRLKELPAEFDDEYKSVEELQATWRKQAEEAWNSSDETLETLAKLSLINGGGVYEAYFKNGIIDAKKDGQTPDSYVNHCLNVIAQDQEDEAYLESQLIDNWDDAELPESLKDFYLRAKQLAPEKVLGWSFAAEHLQHMYKDYPKGFRATARMKKLMENDFVIEGFTAAINEGFGLTPPAVKFFEGYAGEHKELRKALDNRKTNPRFMEFVTRFNELNDEARDSETLAEDMSNAQKQADKEFAEWNKNLLAARDKAPVETIDKSETPNNVAPMDDLERELRKSFAFPKKPNPIRDRIEAAGIQYPMNWDEMGSSEKDLWEDRIIARLDKQEHKQGGSQ